MDKLKVALFVKPSQAPRQREDRNMGYWSYPVDEFEWTHYAPHGSTIHTRRFDQYDLIFWEDGGSYQFVDNGGPPVVYMSIDSTLSDAHYKTRLMRAKNARLVLVDHDKLARFKSVGVPVRRLSYCVNDRVFKPVDEKLFDVSYHCSSGARKGAPGGVQRNEWRATIHLFCDLFGYTFKSGVLPLLDYSKSMAQSRVVVNWPRTPLNRPHRILDAMACRSAVLTGPIPQIDEDYLADGIHYATFTTDEELGHQLGRIITDGAHERYAMQGHNLVSKLHTWKVRAKQLREILREEFGL